MKIKIGNKEIPIPLLVEYLAAIRAMELYRTQSDKFYVESNRRRAELHEEILSMAGTNHDDETFARALALAIESFLEGLNHE